MFGNKYLWAIATLACIGTLYTPISSAIPQEGIINLPAFPVAPSAGATLGFCGLDLMNPVTELGPDPIPKVPFIACGAVTGVTNCKDSVQSFVVAHADILTNWRIHSNAWTDIGSFNHDFYFNGSNTLNEQISDLYPDSTFIQQFQIVIMAMSTSHGSDVNWTVVAYGSTNPAGVVSCF